MGGPYTVGLAGYGLGLGQQPNPADDQNRAALWQDAIAAANGSSVTLAGDTVFYPSMVDASPIETVGDNTSFHTQVVRAIAAQVEAVGGKAAMEVPLNPVWGGPGPRVDLLYQLPDHPPTFLDVKTGDRPRDTPLQEQYYPLIPVGGHLISNDPRITQFGLTPGAPLPPMRFEYFTQRDANSPVQVDPHQPRQ